MDTLLRFTHVLRREAPSRVSGSIEEAGTRVYDRDSGTIDRNAKLCWNHGHRRMERERMDVLSDVLRVVRLTSAVFFTARFSSPWSIESPPSDQLARYLSLRAESIALFHVLVEGRCMVSVEGHAPMTMEAHD